MDPMAMLKPSIPIDELDFHQFEFEKCQEWLSSAARRTEDQKGNREGVMNVKLHALEHRQFMMAMAAAMAPAPVPQPQAHGASHPPQAPPPGAPPKAPAAPQAAPAI